MTEQILMTGPQHDSNQQPLEIIAPENVWQMNRSVPYFPLLGPCFPPLHACGIDQWIGGRLEFLSVSGSDMVL